MEEGSWKAEAWQLLFQQGSWVQSLQAQTPQPLQQELQHWRQEGLQLQVSLDLQPNMRFTQRYGSQCLHARVVLYMLAAATLQMRTL